MQTARVDSNSTTGSGIIEEVTSTQSSTNAEDQSTSAVQNFPQAVLTDLSLMYLLQQQQQQPSTTVSGSLPGTETAAMMMMSPAALQSLLVSQMVAAMQPTASPVNAHVPHLIPLHAGNTTTDSSISDLHPVLSTGTPLQTQHLSQNGAINASVVCPLISDTANGDISNGLRSVAVPKKPLTPYMKFSKSIWQHVKNTNPSMSVCEVGASIGRLWREMSDANKQQYNDDFTREKVQYEADLQEFLKVTGMNASDVAKLRPASSKKSSSKDRSRAGPVTVTVTPSLPSMAEPVAVPDGVAVSSVLPHITQIWPPNNVLAPSATAVVPVQNGTEVGGEVHQTGGSRLSSSDQVTGGGPSNLADGLMQSLLMVSSGGASSVWQDVDAGRLPTIDPLQCPDLPTSSLAEGLEPGEVVFEGGVAQIGPMSNGTVATAHNLYNSYAFNPWAKFRASAASVTAPLASAPGICERGGGILQTELRHLHTALDEKTREVSELTRNLQNAYETIEKLRQTRDALMPADKLNSVVTVDHCELVDHLDSANTSADFVEELASNVTADMTGSADEQAVNVPEIELTELCCELTDAGTDNICDKSPTTSPAQHSVSDVAPI